MIRSFWHRYIADVNANVDVSQFRLLLLNLYGINNSYSLWHVTIYRMFSDLANIMGFYSWATPIQKSQGSDFQHTNNSAVFGIITLSISILSSQVSKKSGTWDWKLISLWYRMLDKTKIFRYKIKLRIGSLESQQINKSNGVSTVKLASSNSILCWIM